METKEKCPSCKAPLEWQLGYDYYCIGGESGPVEDIKSDHGEINLHFCTCGRQIAVHMETEEGCEVFINSENIGPE